MLPPASQPASQPATAATTTTVVVAAAVAGRVAASAVASSATGTYYYPCPLRETILLFPLLLWSTCRTREFSALGALDGGK